MEDRERKQDAVKQEASRSRSGGSNFLWEEIPDKYLSRIEALIWMRRLLKVFYFS